MSFEYINDISDVATVVSIFLLVLVYIRNKWIFSTWRAKAIGLIFIWGSIHRQFSKMVFDVSIESATPGFVLVVSAVLIGIPLFSIGIFSIIYHFGYKNSPVSILGYEKFIIGLFILNIFTLIYGVYAGNSIRYIASDTYKILIFFVGYYLGRSILFQDYKSYRGWTNFFLEIFVVLAIRTAIIQILSIINGRLVEVVSFTYAPFILFAFLLVDGLNVTGESQVYWSNPTKLIVGTGALISSLLLLSRATWLILMGMSFVYIVLVLSRNQKSRVGTIAATSFPIVGITGLYIVINFVGSIGSQISALVSALYAEISNLSNVGQPGWKADGSLDQKLAEGLDVLEHFSNNASILNYLFGFGNGAQYLAIHGKATSLAAAERTYGVLNHNVHNLIFAQFLRRGLAGTLLTVFIFVGGVRVFFSVWNSDREGIVKTLSGTTFLFVLAIFVSDMSAASSFQNAPFAIYFGLAGGIIAREYRDRNLTNKSTEVDVN